MSNIAYEFGFCSGLRNV